METAGISVSTFKTSNQIQLVRADLPVRFLWSRLDRNHSETNRTGVEAMINKTFPKVKFFNFMAFKSRDYREATTLSRAPNSLKEFMKELIKMLKDKDFPSLTPVADET